MVDLGIFEDAWATVETIREGETGRLENLCLENYYLTAALLKLECLCPGLALIEKEALLKIQPPQFHPGQLIAFWKYQINKQEGEITKQEELITILKVCDQNKCNALMMINACLGSQLIHDDKLNAEELPLLSLSYLSSEKKAIEAILRKYPVEPENKFGFLNPLKLNYW